ncbi:putative sulfate exporter family transporter [Nesterenkonia sp. LB17]|uniref:YeiH family protein n=1 Tax=unclassified Nesterenkonia TaxID=2629769 RepID=UPI001F4CA32E|nr:putative sulfate exporter family transporter [Nesterenkonia sp. DZ6]MCH8562582.1 putative sulfate exporter family transporter [Nesterenkonia sp. YGD6]MCH8565506.1 putative sulfate exporter family transporter [Nesterenkonia sp. LB17]
MPPLTALTSNLTSRLTRLWCQTAEILPGAALALIFAIAAHRLIAEQIPVISGLLVAVLAGIALRSLGWVPFWAERGLGWAAKKLLRVGIVLLGLQLALGDLLGLGWAVLAVVVLTVGVTFFGMLALGRLLGAPKGMTTLLAAGTAICGASAVAAAAAAIDRGDGKDDDGAPVQAAAAAAVAVVTLYGTLALLALPALGTLLGLGEEQMGVWIGASIHEVGQVVAAGGVVGAVALATATLVKLARVVLLAPVIAGISLAGRRRRAVGAAQGAGEGVEEGAGSRPPLIPLFVLGFLVMMVLRSVTDLPESTLDFSADVTTMLLTTAMVGVGASVDLRRLLRQGGPALLLGAGGTVLAVGTGLGGVLLLVS